MGSHHTALMETSCSWLLGPLCKHLSSSHDRSRQPSPALERSTMSLMNLVNSDDLGTISPRPEGEHFPACPSESLQFGTNVASGAQHGVCLFVCFFSRSHLPGAWAAGRECQCGPGLQVRLPPVIHSTPSLTNFLPLVLSSGIGSSCLYSRQGCSRILVSVTGQCLSV